MSSPNKTCLTCRYFARGEFVPPEPSSLRGYADTPARWREQGQKGDCRKNAPSAGDGFPFVWEFMWCGEWEE